MRERRAYGTGTEILDESLFDDIAPEEVEDDDSGYRTEYGTEMFIHSQCHYPSEYLPRCLPVLTDRSAAGDEDRNHCSAFTFDRSGLRIADLFRFVAAAFCMSGCEKTRIGATKEYGLTVEKKFYGMWITTKKPFGTMFRMFSGSGRNDEVLLRMLVRILYMRLHDSGLLGKFGDVFYVKWIRGRKTEAFVTDGSGKFAKIEPYESIYRFDDGVAVVKDGNKWNIIDTDGNLAGEWFRNGDNMNDVFGDGRYIPCEIAKHKWNFVNRKREFLLDEPLYANTVYGFGESGYAKVERPGDLLCNYVDRKGKFLMDRWAKYYEEPGDGFVLVMRGDYRNRNAEYNYARVPDGSPLLGEWLRTAYGFKDGRAVVCTDGRVSFMNGNYVREPDYNMVGTDGKFIFKRKYNWIWTSRYGYNVVQRGEEYNIADGNGKFMLEWAREVHICTERIVQTCTSRNHSAKNMRLFDMKNGMEEICRGEFMAEYGEAGFICAKTAGDKWNLFRYDGSMLLENGMPSRFSVPEFKDGMFITSDGLGCVRFDTEGNMVLYV